MTTSTAGNYAKIELLSCPAWQSFEWLIHGFSTRTGGYSTAYGDAPPGGLNLGLTVEDDQANVLQNRATLLEALTVELPADGRASYRLITLSQVHSARVHLVAHGAKLDSGDGMFTDKPGNLLAILTADCIPVLLVDPEHKAVAAVHAGWRGTVQGIVSACLDQMRLAFDTRPEAALAAIGPGIGGCCYRVGEEVWAQFRENFEHADAYFEQVRDGGLYLDLAEANRQQLLEAGMPAQNIHALQQCTHCQPERFFSYRGQGGRTGRMMSVIGIRATDAGGSAGANG